MYARKKIKKRWPFLIGRDVSMLKHAIDVGKAQGADDGLINEAQHVSHSQDGVELLPCVVFC